METATYRLIHPESDSVVFAEFALKDGTTELIGVTFLKGNVVDINNFRKVKQLAQTKFLSNNQRFFWE